VDDRFLPAAVGVDAGHSGHPSAGLYVMSATPMSSQAQPLKVFLCHGWGDTGRAGTLPPVEQRWLPAMA
jgi:hypothetical protein